MKTRIITAIVALVLLAVVLCFHSTIVLNIAVVALTAIMMFELFRANKLLKSALFVGSLCLSVFFPLAVRFLSLENCVYIYLAVIFAYIVLYALDVFIGYEKTDVGVYSTVALYSLLISISMSSLCVIESSSKQFGLLALILTFCGAWLDDTGAYFAGTFLGKHKLCPKISPKKTVEGFIGGILTDVILFLVFGLVVDLTMAEAQVNYILMALLGAGCALLGVAGDLFASVIKRHCDVKDYGNLFPGHGGALDRFDSVVFVAPFMALCASGIGIF
ncbi:MAG: phosphatidate cytidylyltransferase [Oscillospiraceae bacterium]|nr:phosphatidate cytidylyltransferase [Oscillospiraceae bacterium]